MIPVLCAALACGRPTTPPATSASEPASPQPVAPAPAAPTSLASVLGAPAAAETLDALEAAGAVGRFDIAAEWSEIADFLEKKAPALSEAVRAADPEAENFANFEALAPRARAVGHVVIGFDEGGEDFLLAVVPVDAERDALAAAQRAGLDAFPLGE